MTSRILAVLFVVASVAGCAGWRLRPDRDGGAGDMGATDGLGVGPINTLSTPTGFGPTQIGHELR